MLTLSTHLSTVGISSAKGVDLVMQRDQINATVSNGNSSATTADASGSKRLAARKELTVEQQRQVAELQQIDKSVREHEQAHIAAGRGVVTSGANYTYTYGPDGKQYATGGEVGIDTSPEQKPEANIDKGQRIQAAALAPRDPSPQDYRVASVGGQLEARGHTDLAQQQAERAAQEQKAKRQQEEASRQVVPATGGGQQANVYTGVAIGPAGAKRINVFA